VHHTDCGSGLLADDALRHGFIARTGYGEEALKAVPVLDPAATVRTDVATLLADPRVSRKITVSGHVYDTTPRRVRTVVEPSAPRPRARA
jgi:carbonic anhydrase